jgi:hypothetical protein
MSTITKSIWELLETPANGCENVAGLIEWSMNYDISKGTPYHIFLDLIGYSDEHYGESLYKGEPRAVLGYVELDYLADALKEYATNPQCVSDYIDLIDNADRESA